MAEKKYTRIDSKSAKSSSKPASKGAGKPAAAKGGFKKTSDANGKGGFSNSKNSGKSAAKKGNDKRGGKGKDTQRETLNQFLASRLQEALDSDYEGRTDARKRRNDKPGRKRITGTVDDERHEAKTTKRQRGFAAMANGGSKPATSSQDAKADKAPKPNKKYTTIKSDRKDKAPRDFDKKDTRKERGGKVATSTKSPCPVDALCGGCSNITVPYEKQLKVKTAQVKGLLWEANLPIKGVDVRPILGMEDPFHYRNKVSSPFARGKKLKDAKGTKADARDKGRRRKLEYEVLTGMYRAGTHQLVSTDGCLIENQQANRVIKVIKNLMIHHGIQPYDEDSGEGFMRHVVVRVGHNSGEVLVTLVTNQRDFPSSKAFCRELISRCPYVTTVVQNVNTRQTNVILGQEEHVLYGPGFILDTLCDLSFRISSQSFYQVNAVQTEVLYRTAIDFAGLTGEETVIDAYCGTGTIGLVAAKNGAASVIGVDNVPDAIRDAKNNAAHNNIENSLFIAGDAGQTMREWAAEGKLNPAKTVLMMDPPRAGSSKEFLDAACQLAPARIVYISCNPETQMRDLRILVDNGYQLKIVQPVDMFPQTDHVETVALLTK